MIWTEKFSGDGFVYYNGGAGSALGSDFLWADPGSVYSYSGNAAGACTVSSPGRLRCTRTSLTFVQFYPDVDGDGRADQVFVLESFNNIAGCALNTCGGGDSVGDDPDSLVDPSLPVMPGGNTGGGTGGGSGSGDGDDDGCRAGTGPAGLADICSFACSYGFCPSPCTCTSRPGTGMTRPTQTRTNGTLACASHVLNSF